MIRPQKELSVPEKRRHLFINKPFQLRYMAYLTGILFFAAAVILAHLYFGIWGGVLEAFGDTRIQNDLVQALRVTDYEEARIPADPSTAATPLSFFKEAEKLSRRQQEVFKEILDATNKKLIPKFLLLLTFIVFGSIYISHKIAGPLYRFYVGLAEIGKGNLRTRIHLRKYDEAHPLAARFNKDVESLDFTFSRIKNIIRENDSNPERLKTRLQEELSKIKTSADH